MRSSNRRTLIVLVAVLAMSVVATASASAATPEWYVKGKALSTKLAEGKFGAGQEGLSTSAVMPLTLTTHIAGGGKVVIECKSVSSTGSKIVAGGTGTSTAIALKECKVTTPMQCKVPATITTNEVTSSLFYVDGVEVWNQLKAKTGGTFATIRISECSIEGSYTLGGEMCSKESAPSGESVAKDEVFASKPTGEGARSCTLEFLGTTSTTSLEGTLAFDLAGGQLGSIWTGR